MFHCEIQNDTKKLNEELKRFKPIPKVSEVTTQQVIGTHLSITNSVHPVIILPLKSRSPVQYIKTEKGKKIALPTLEKLLVDIYKEEEKIILFRAQKWKEYFTMHSTGIRSITQLFLVMQKEEGRK